MMYYELFNELPSSKSGHVYIKISFFIIKTEAIPESIFGKYVKYNHVWIKVFFLVKKKCCWNFLLHKVHENFICKFTLLNE